MKLDQFKPKIKKEQVLRMMECFEGDQLYEELSVEYENCYHEVQAVLSPCALISFAKLPQSELVPQNLWGKEAVYILLTLGAEFSELLKQREEKGEHTQALLLDTMADALIFNLEKQVTKHVQSMCKERHVGVAGRLEAYSDLPAAFQNIICEELDSKQYGVTCNESYILEPVKSMTYVLEITEDETQFHAFHNCAQCRENGCKMKKSYQNKIDFIYHDETKTVFLDKGMTLMEGIRNTFPQLTFLCGGRGDCGRCQIRFLKGASAITAAEKRCFEEAQLQSGYRLACKAKPKGDCAVEILFREEVEHAILTTYAQQSFGDKKQPAKKDKPYGIAVDIGSTTIVMQLILLQTGEAVETYAAMNRQRSFGADVLSRIQAANEGASDQLTSSIRRDIQKGFFELCMRKNISSTMIQKVVIAGNTTMLHLLLGYSVKGLGTYPFSPVSLRAESFLGDRITLPDYVSVHTLPGISAFVGADIAAGIDAMNMHGQDKVTMLIDLGTNGEMAISDGRRLLCTSAAAGPAFEGGNISCGTGSVAGAICAADAVRACGKIMWKLSTIDDKPPIGICGTGLIEVICELKKNGLIDETGSFLDDFFEEGFEIAKNVVITNRDVRQFQMAKAAIRAGIELLVKEFGITPEQVETVYLAGGFSKAMNVEKSIAIGLLPAAFRDCIKPVCNTSLSGAVKTLMSGEHPILEQFDEIREITLAELPLFEEYYFKYMSITNIGIF